MKNILNRFASLLTLFLLLVGSNVGNSQCNFEQGPIGEICSKAYYICGSELNGYVGKLRKENSTNEIWPGDKDPDRGICGLAWAFNNTSWYSFTACAKKVHIRIKFYNCQHPKQNQYETGIQVALYNKCKKGESVACQEIYPAVGGTIDLVYNNFVPGELVYFVLDGYDSSVCEFEVEVVEGINTTPVTVPTKDGLNDGYITGNNLVSCSEINQPLNYTVTPADCTFAYNNACAPSNSKINPIDSICYVWQVTPKDGRSFVQADSVGKTVQIAFTKPGIYTISTEGFLHPFYGGSCASGVCGDIKTWQVEVLAPSEIINATILACPSVPFEYCNQKITQDTTIRCQQDDCTFITQSIEFKTLKLSLLGTQFLCSGASFDFQGSSYSTPGDYQVIDQSDCSLLHKFKIEALTLEADIISSATQLNCTHKSINLNATARSNGNNSLTYRWENANGTKLGNTGSLNITEDGVYKVICEVNAGSSSCKIEKSITISKDINLPQISLVIPTLRCLLPNEKNPILSFTSNNPLSSVQWTSPLGNKVNQQNITIDSINVASNKPYMLSVIGANGCKKDTSLTILSDFSKVGVTLESDSINCRNPKSTITLRTSQPIDSLRWYQTAPTPSFYGSFKNNESIEVDAPGMYQAQVMSRSSKCWSNGSTEVFADRMLPELNLGTDQVWNCNTKSLDIIPQVATGSNITYQWSTKNGGYNSDVNAKNANVTGPGVYTMEVENNANGCFRKDTILIVQERNVPTSMYYQSFSPSCFESKDASIVISGVEGGFGPYAYFLNDNNVNINELDKLSAGDYELKVVDKNGCSTETDIVITDPLKVEIDLPKKIGIDFTEELVLQANTNFDDSEINTYLWKDNNGNILGTEDQLTLIGEQNLVITLEVITNNGCIARSSINIVVDNELKIYFPNVFSPNGDGNNDIFFIGKNKIPATLGKMTFYDRFGNMMYNVENAEFGNPEFGWNGMHRGQYVQPGVYVYIIEYTDYFGKKHIAKKDLTVLR